MEKNKPRILIIEDYEHSREAIEHPLNAKGCEIISMAGGRGLGRKQVVALRKRKAGSQAQLFLLWLLGSPPLNFRLLPIALGS